MPDAPETWLDEHVVADNAGSQQKPQITLLSDGRILVACQDDTDAMNPGAGILGRLYPPMGYPPGAGPNLFPAARGRCQTAFTMQRPKKDWPQIPFVA